MTAKFAYDGARIISRPSSLISALATTVESAAADVAYRHKVGDAWQEVTWGEVGAAVNSAAAAYADLGVKPGDSVVVLADVSYSAIVAELAATAAGAVVTTLNSKVSSADLAFVLADLRPALAVAGQVEDAANLRSRVGAPDQIVLLDGDQGFTWSKLLTEGADALARSPRTLADRAEALDTSAVATRLLSRGESGAPVLVPGRHTSWTYQGSALVALGLVTKADNLMLWSPMDDLLTRALVAAQIVDGFAATIETDLSSLSAAFAEVTPTVFGASRAAFSQLRLAMLDYKIDGKAWTRSPLRVLDAALEVHEAERNGEIPPAVLRRRAAPLAKLRSFFGDNLKYCISDGGVTSDVAAIFDLLEVQVVGAMSSPITSGFASIDNPEDPRTWTVGRSLPYSEITTDDDGLLCVRGPGVFPEEIPGWGHSATDLGDGWQSTGREGVAFDGGYVAVTVTEEIEEPETSLAVDGEDDAAAGAAAGQPVSFLEAALAAQRRRQQAEAPATSHVDEDDDEDVDHDDVDEVEEPQAEAEQADHTDHTHEADQPGTPEPIATEPAAEETADDHVDVTEATEHGAQAESADQTEQAEPVEEPAPVVVAEPVTMPELIHVDGVLEAVAVPAAPGAENLATEDAIDDDTAHMMDARFARLCAPAVRLFVTGSGPEVVGLVALDNDGLHRWASAFHVSGRDFADLAASDDCHGFVDACIQALNARLPKHHKIQNFAILDRPLVDQRASRSEVLTENACLVDQLNGLGMGRTESLHNTDVSRTH